MASSSFRTLMARSSLLKTPASRWLMGSKAAPLSTSPRLRLKESSSQTDEDFDKHKQDSLAKQRQGSGHWKRELASDSEEALKADRAGPEDVAQLQERTKRAAEETKRAGTSPHDGM